MKTAARQAGDAGTWPFVVTRPIKRRRRGAAHRRPSLRGRAAFSGQPGCGSLNDAGPHLVRLFETSVALQ